MTLNDIHQPSLKDLGAIPWTGVYWEYDMHLYNSGYGNGLSLCLNPHIDDHSILDFVDTIPWSLKCITWTYKGNWIAKLFRDGWNPTHGYEEIEIQRPELIWYRNSEIDKLMTFENDPYTKYEPKPWELDYKFVWYLDPRVTAGEKVWAMSVQTSGHEVNHIIDMGYIMPEIDVEFNEHLPDLGIDVDTCYPEYWELEHECAWELDPKHQTNDEVLWVVKFSPRYKKPRDWKWMGIVTPQIHIEYNPDLPMMDYDLDYVIPWHDLAYEHVWMLDNKHLKNDEEEIWAFKIRVTEDIVGTSIIDYISPVFYVEYNPDIPKMDYDLDYVMAWYDFKFEHIWMLDRKHLHNDEEDIWTFKIRVAEEPEGAKFIDYVAPVPTIKTNPDLLGFNFDSEDTPYHDLQYRKTWMYNGMWAVKQSYVRKPKGEKYIKDEEPIYNIEFNNSLKNLYAEIDYKIDYYDRYYEHIWYTLVDGEKVWIAKMSMSNNIQGTKDMGVIETMIPPELDVFFISYDEENAEDNWNRLLTKAPNAKRIQGVTGIFEAHKAAAEQATTDMFYVVDGDAYLLDEWKFDFQPSLYDRDCVYVWNSQNPVTSLIYGYGGVKLFPTSKVRNTKRWGTDLTLSVGKKFKVIDQVSNISKFNTSEFKTWRSAFRECAKLAKKTDKESLDRLKKWLNPTKGAEFAKWAKLGAQQGIEFAEQNSAINKVNNYSWLLEYFEELNGRR